MCCLSLLALIASTVRFLRTDSKSSSRAYLKLTVVLDYCEELETYSRIELLRSYGNLQSYWNTRKLQKITVVFEYYEAMEIHGGIELLRSHGDLQSYCT